jgi:hypothetical protein
MLHAVGANVVRLTRFKSLSRRHGGTEITGTRTLLARETIG